MWEHMLSAENLGRAPWRVRANGGAPGADGMTTEELVPWLREHWAATRQDQLATLLPMSERVLGPEHPDTLTARHNLARWTERAGDAAGARDQLAPCCPSASGLLAATLFAHDPATFGVHVSAWLDVDG